MSISRETFDPTKNYKRIRYHQTNGRLELDCIIVDSSQVPIFEVVEL